MKVRLFALLSVLATPVVTEAADVTDLFFTESATSVTITDCKSSATGPLVIPATINGKPVTQIGSEAFWGANLLTSIEVPSSVTSIGHYAFYECSGLTTVTLPANVTSIGYFAFYQCSSLTSVALPPGLTSISQGLFQGCTSLPAVEIPAGVTRVHPGAFQNCKALATMTFPAAVTAIESSTFANCSALVSVSIPAGVTNIEAYAFSKCGSLASLTIPPNLESVGTEAFLDCASMPGISIPATLVSIGARAFSGCASLTAVSIPAGLGSIGKAAFARCTSLGQIPVDPANANYASIGGILCSKDGTILYQCGGASLTATIPPAVTIIEESAFNGCGKLTTLTVPASVEQISSYAFDNCPKLKTFLFFGNLPGYDGNSFTWSPTTTVYHLAGRAGWSIFDELPSAVVGSPSIAVGLSDIVTAPGGNASLHVGVDPVYPLPCRFRWQKNGIDIPGATQSTLSLPDIQPGDAGVYTVLISSDVGTVSDQATLSLNGGNLYTQSQYDAGVTLGYQLGRQAGIEEIMEEPNAFDLFSTAQIQALHIGTPLLTRDASTGQFELKITARKSADLSEFSPFSFAAGELTLSPSGELLFRFTSPDNAAFFRVDAE